MTNHYQFSLKRLFAHITLIAVGLAISTFTSLGSMPCSVTPALVAIIIVSIGLVGLLYDDIRTGVAVGIATGLLMAIGFLLVSTMAALALNASGAKQLQQAAASQNQSIQN